MNVLQNFKLKLAYKNLVMDGAAIEYKKISICNLKDHLSGSNNYRPLYQVHSDNHRVRFTEVYREIDDAINKFFDLRLIIDR